MKPQLKRQRPHLPLSILALLILMGAWPGTRKVSPVHLSTRSSSVAAPEPPGPLEVQLDLSYVISLVTGGDSRPATSFGEVSDLMGALLDPTQPLSFRKHAAWRLAKSATAQSLSALRRGLISGPPELKVAIAEALGASGSPEAGAILKGLLSDENESVVRGALRGLAGSGGDKAAMILSGVVQDAKQSQPIRVEAALALGELPSGDSVGRVAGLIATARDPEIVEALLSAMGRFPFEQTRDFFQRYLDATETDLQLRAASLEALGRSGGFAAPFLAAYLDSEEAEIRGAAAWALANLENPADTSRPLMARLDVEADPEVRVRLYQALGNQPYLDADILPLVLVEPDASAQLAGYHALAGHIVHGDPALAAHFDAVIVPKLEEGALAGATLNDKLGSVIALKQAGTPGALRALADIGVRSRDGRILQAAKIK